MQEFKSIFVLQMKSAQDAKFAFQKVLLQKNSMISIFSVSKSGLAYHSLLISETIESKTLSAFPICNENKYRTKLLKITDSSIFYKIGFVKI